MRFTLRRLLLVVAAYGVSLGLCSRLGAPFWIALWIGTGWSGIVLLSRRQDLWSSVAVAIASGWGALFGVTCLTDSIIRGVHGYDHGFGERTQSMALGGTIGAILGGFIASLFTRRNRRL
jgi:hypothetical protein